MSKEQKETSVLEMVKKDQLVFTNEQPYVRPTVDISIPPNHLELVEATLKEYKKWLKENQELQRLADEAETDEEQEEASLQCSLHFKQRYAGVIGKDVGDRLSPSKIKKMWDKFMTREYRGFLQAHTNLTLHDILTIGVDKFFYVMGWKKPSDVSSWRQNKVRVGYCCHCRDQFIPMFLQTNQGLCLRCRPKFSTKAIRNYLVSTLHSSARYHHAQHDLMMDFHIMFYTDAHLRSLFLKGNDFAKALEQQDEVPLPEWMQLPSYATKEEEDHE